ESRWLPTQYPASNVQAEGDWRFDDSTMDFLAVPEDLTTAGLQYTMSAVELQLSAERLENAGSSAGKVNESFTDYPADIPRIVRELAASVTQDETTRFEKAVALQNWFRSTGGFEYSLETRATGNGVDALTTFLTEGPDGRTGYCEQFASAMTLMARVLGIPARVAIGFLTPEPSGPNTWIYSSHDMHAWPELYFEGSGWVRFEPTPARRATDVPAYTVNGVPDDPGPSETTQTRSASATPGPTNRPTQSTGAADSAADDEGDAGVNWGPLAGVTGGVALVTAVLLLPSLARRRRRERRLASGGPEEIWAELRDTAADLRVPWPASRSPRETRDALVGYLGRPVDSSTPDRPAHGEHVSPEGAEAFGRLVRDLERLRYSRSPGEADRERLHTDGQTVIACLAGGAPRAARRRATWWPRSILDLGVLRPTRTAPATVEARYGGVVDHAG
ncbi:MAG TPA: transglutaminase-like domain-containing protein, partial [Nocardioides sp.]|nr:transglutaminase-like domain-containing protein [Nocardioides sp.]